MKKSRKTKPQKSEPKYTLEITVKDESGKVLFGHRSDGSSFSYDHRVKEYQFTPASFTNDEHGVNQTTWETTLQIGAQTVSFESVRIDAGEMLPFRNGTQYGRGC
jgi:hypothetical protein